MKHKSCIVFHGSNLNYTENCDVFDLSYFETEALIIIIIIIIIIIVIMIITIFFNSFETLFTIPIDLKSA